MPGRRRRRRREGNRPSRGRIATRDGSDQWNFYQARKIRQYDTQLTADLLAALTVRDQAAAGKALRGVPGAKRNQALSEGQTAAQEFEHEVRLSERRANRFDLGEALPEIGLVIVSITLLTRQRSCWYRGLGFGAAGIIAAALGFTIH